MGKRQKSYSYFILIGLISFSLISGVTAKSLGSQEGINSKEALLANQNKTILSQSANADSEGVILAQNKLVFESNNAMEIIVTAYSSSPDETDDTPFITASGMSVGKGIAAANFLPIGTKFRLPNLFGDQVFVVEDRLHSRFNDRIDIWMESKEKAKKFGQKIGRLEILE